MPEALLREVTGITEQALKDTRLTPAEHSDFTHRLADARQAQTQYHKARAATKTKPPVDTSGSNLPMGELVFGKPPDPGKSFPGLIQPGGWRRPASLTAPITFTDPLTGAVVERDEPDKMRNGEHVRAQAGDTAPGVSDSLIKGPINPVRTVKTADSSVRLKGRDRRAATSEQSTLGHSNNASVHEALQKAGHSKKAIKTLTSRAAKLRDSGTAAPLPSDGSAQPTSKPGTNPKVVAPISAVDSQLHHPDLQEVQAHFNTTSRSSTENGSMRKIRKAATSIASAQRPGGNAGTLKDGPQLQPGNRSHSSVKLLSSDGGDTFNIVHAANTKIERPLPQRIRDVAEANDIPIEIAQQVRDDFGGPFSSPAMVRYLRSQYPANLTDAAATTLVNTVRSVQNDSTRVIKTLIDAAASRTNWLGLPAAAFSVQEVEGITAAMNAQPLTDSDAARLLYRVVASPDFKPYRGANSLARKEFDGLLNRAGYARVPVSAVWQRPQGALPINHRDTKHTATDPTFARLLAQTGSAQSNPARLGIVDSFSPIRPLTARLSTVYSPGYEPDGIYLKHGHEVASVAIRGLGPWNQAVLATFNGNVETVPAIVDAMALRGIRAVNFSLGPTTSEAGEILLSIFDRHPDVMFVVGAGNDYTDRATLPAYSSVGSTLDNVIYVGSVDRQSKLAKSSNTGQDQLFAFGKDRTVASVKGDEQDYWITTPITKVKSGTSLSGPDVANTLAKMGILNPEMPPVLSKNILFASATRVTQTGPAGRRVESVPVINHEDALTLSALGGLFARQQRPVIGAQVQRDAQTGQSLGRRTWEPAASGQPVTLQDCADILRLKAADRARLLPLADRLFLTGTGR